MQHLSIQLIQEAIKHSKINNSIGPDELQTPKTPRHLRLVHFIQLYTLSLNINFIAHRWKLANIKSIKNKNFIQTHFSSLYICQSTREDHTTIHHIPNIIIPHYFYKGNHTADSIIQHRNHKQLLKVFSSNKWSKHKDRLLSTYKETKKRSP